MEKRKTMETTTTMRTNKKLKAGYLDMMVMELDTDILVEIFSLLPFIKATQCRCVCKSWRTLLDDDFLMNILAKLHGYDHHPAHCSSSSSSSSTIMSFISFSREKTSLFGFYDDNLCSYKENSFTVSSSSKLLRGTTMINSCNGLICLNTNDYNQPTIAIYNPVTTKFLRLPWDCHYRNGGFGYDPSTKEYKILRTMSKEGSRPSYCHQIYTLGTTGIWKDVKAGSGRYFNYDVPGVHVNGALYWITGTGGNLIMSFDLADEEFRILTVLPPVFNNMKPKPHYKLKLVESQGCLFLFVDQYSCRPDNKHIELWEMKKKDMGRAHGIRYDWSNVMGISTVDHCIYGGDYEFLARTQSGKVLFWHYGIGLTCFDPRTKRFALIKDVPASSPHRNRSGSAAIVPHTNCLVSFIA